MSSSNGNGHLALGAASQRQEPVRQIDTDAARIAAADLLVALGADLTEDGLWETPRRMVDAYAESRRTRTGPSGVTICGASFYRRRRHPRRPASPKVRPRVVAQHRHLPPARGRRLR